MPNHLLLTQLIEKFENQTLAGEEFDHLQHLQVAWHYVCNHDLDNAKSRFHTNLLKLVQKLGAEHKYHKTVTDFFIDYLFQLRLYLGGDDWSLLEENCPLLIHDARKLIGFYYSDELIHSDLARREFVGADIMPLDRASLKFSEEDIPVFRLKEYSSPVIVSIPHNGQFIPHDILETMLPTAALSKDTDWYLSQLYRFLDEIKVTSISANYSRYVIDLNRDSAGKALYKNADNTELCPTSTFHLEPLYEEDEDPDILEVKQRTELYWKPYHQELVKQVAKAKDEFGYAIVLEAHSIAQEVPRFFDGKLPDFNFGTNDGATVSGKLAELLDSFDTGDYSKVINGRFKGGFITRNYAKPEDNVFTIQLELSQATYMHSDKLELDLNNAQKVIAVIKRLLLELCQIDN